MTVTLALPLNETYFTLSGTHILENQILRDCIKEFLATTESEFQKLKYKEAMDEIKQVTDEILSKVVELTENMQQHVETYENIPLKNPQLYQLYNAIKSMTEIDVSIQTTEFRTKWKMHKLILSTHILLMLNDCETAKQACKYVIFWLRQNIGSGARLTSMYGFASHLLAFIHRILKIHEESIKCYDSALEAYKGEEDNNWKNLEAKNILIGMVRLSQRQARPGVKNFTGERRNLSLYSCN